MAQNATLHDRLREVAVPDMVLQHLQKYGVAPYLPVMSRKLEGDIQWVMSKFGLNERDAMTFMVRCSVGPESAAAAGGERSTLSDRMGELRPSSDS